jgi:TetR/AcrR family transcriptional repressor of nem operon
MQDSKTKLLDVGVDAVRLGGYDGVSIKDIVTEAGVPKGSFHYYFKSKEDFGLALIDHFSESMRKLVQAILTGESLSAMQRLRGFFQVYAERMRDEEFKTGCLVGLMVMETTDKSEALRRRAQAALTELQSLLKMLIEQAQAEGDIDCSLDSRSLAAFLANSWQGALLRMKAQQSDLALRDFDKFVFGQLLAAGEE